MIFVVWSTTWPSKPGLRFTEITREGDAPMPDPAPDVVITPVLSYQCEDESEDDDVAEFVLYALDFQSWELAAMLCNSRAQRHTPE